MSLSSQGKDSRRLRPDGALKIHSRGLKSDAMVIEPANLGENQAFERLAEPFRREIKLHCYRMLGSLHEADDLVQETYLRAWRSFSSFEAGSSRRARIVSRVALPIATNACLNALEGSQAPAAISARPAWPCRPAEAGRRPGARRALARTVSRRKPRGLRRRRAESRGALHCAGVRAACFCRCHSAVAAAPARCAHALRCPRLGIC